MGTDLIEVFRTSDMGLAAFLMWKGCQQHEEPWRKVQGFGSKTKLEFAYSNVDPRLVDQYRTDKEGIRRYNDIRRFLLTVAYEETGGK